MPFRVKPHRRGAAQYNEFDKIIKGFDSFRSLTTKQALGLLCHY